MEPVVALAGALAALAVVVWFFFGRSPEDAASHLPEDERRGARLDHVTERPAGPGAEAQNVVGRGEISAGPGEGPSSGEPPRHRALP